MIDLKYWHGSHHLSPASDIKTFELAGLIMSGNGGCKKANFKRDTMVLIQGGRGTELYFAVVVRLLARPTLGERKSSKKR